MSALMFVDHFNRRYDTNFETNKFYIIVFTDRFSRFTKITAISDLQAKTTVKAFENTWIKQMGLPKTILSDQGRNYISKNMKDFCTKKKSNIF